LSAVTTPQTPIALPDTPPAPGEVKEILPGLRWARMPLPFPPRHVNIWLLDDSDGWLVVDAGAQTDDAASLWEQVFAAGLDGRPIIRLLVTHFHPDHVGFAGWLSSRWGGAPLLMTRTEWLQARLLRLDAGEDMIAQQVAFARRAGTPEEFQRFLAGRGPLYVRAVLPLPRQHRRIAAGDALRIGGRSWTVLTGSGHAPEMACLHCPELGVLISADQILPRITPHVGVHATEPNGDPLAEFLTSNERLLAAPPDTLVLPSHGDPFHGLHRRIGSIASHHAERLEMLSDACAARPLTAFDASKVLFVRPLDNRAMGAAIAETLAHVNRLVAAGELEREDGAEVTHYRRRA
jgi:glyoxylase-like metal-dependent hydrolase (beta-lactamase superfamily II)